MQAGLRLVGENPDNPENWVLPEHRQIPQRTSATDLSRAGVWHQSRTARSRSPKTVGADLDAESGDERYNQNKLFVGQQSYMYDLTHSDLTAQPVTPPEGSKYTHSSSSGRVNPFADPLPPPPPPSETLRGTQLPSIKEEPTSAPYERGSAGYHRPAR